MKLQFRLYVEQEKIRRGVIRHPCRATPEIAIHGDLTLRDQHSVSEIADFSQRLETIGYALPCTRSALRPVSLPYCPAPLLT